MSLNNNTTSLQAILTTVNALPDKVDTSGTATAADIYTGKTATVNDAKLTGTNPYNAANVDPAVTSALAAIAEKGVDTTGKGLGDIAALVAAIEAGGGLDFGDGVIVLHGSVTYTERTYTLNVGQAVESGKTAFLVAVKHAFNGNTKALTITVHNGETTLVSKVQVGNGTSMSEFEIAFDPTTGTYTSTTWWFSAGATYSWIFICGK